MISRALAARRALAWAIVAGLTVAVKPIVSGRQATTAPSTDDAYTFAAGSGEEQSVTLERTPEGVRLTVSRPATAGWDTALLGVRSAGAEVEPWVELIAGAARIRQYLDPNAMGLRWLNLTGVREQLANGGTVDLQTHGVTIEPGPATLRLFANRLDLKGRILVLAPHPDDAEIAAFGLYAGRNATIVTVTSGNAGDFNYRQEQSDPAEHYLLKGYLRAVDSVTVPWQGEIPPDRTYNLGYFDARLATMREKPEEVIPEMYGPNQDTSVYRRANIGRLLPVGPRTSTWAHLVEDLATILDRVKPDIIVMPHPFLDTHLDHEFTAVAAIEAIERGKRSPRFLLYTNHASQNLFPFGPAGTAMSIPPWAGAALPIEGVYSHPVPPDLQRRKLFALESMHDLRLSPAEQATCDLPNIKRREDYPRVMSVDYFRRGPRSEETFFVFSRDGAVNLIHAFLAQFKPAN